jgi:O-antigen ligase
MSRTTATNADLLRWPVLPPRLRGGALLGALAAFEALIGVALATSHYKYALMLVLGVAGCWLVWRFPAAGTIVMLFLAAGIIYPYFYVFRFAGRTVFGYEVVLLVLFARAAIAPRSNSWGGAAGAMLALFFCVLVLSTLLAVKSGETSLNNAINWGRPFGARALFWVIVRLFPNRRDLGVLLAGGIVLGAISGVVGLVLALSGNVNTIFNDSSHSVIVAGSVGSLLRVRMPGLALGFMLLWLLLMWIARGRGPRWLWWVCLPWILVDILVSQNRNMWVAGTLSLGLVLLIAGPKVRGRLVASFAFLAAAIAILIAAPQGSGPAPSPLKPIAARASTILDPQAVRTSSSASDRDYEDKEGWATAKHHLVIGIGPGVFYGATIGTPLGNGFESVAPRLFLQNQYLYLLLITGIPGVAAFTLFLLVSVRNAFLRGVPIESRMLGIGVLALALTAIVMLSFTDDSYLTALALVTGAIAALRPTSDDASDARRHAVAPHVSG